MSSIIRAIAGRYFRRDCFDWCPMRETGFSSPDAADIHRCAVSGVAPTRAGKVPHTRTPDPEGGGPFDSRHEARVGAQLRAEFSGPGECVARQARFKISGGSHRVDFCVIRFSTANPPRMMKCHSADYPWYAAEVCFVEAKGRDLGPGRKCRRQVAEEHGVEIHLVPQRRKKT